MLLDATQVEQDGVRLNRSAMSPVGQLGNLAMSVYNHVLHVLNSSLCVAEWPLVTFSESKMAATLHQYVSFIIIFVLSSAK